LRGVPGLEQIRKLTGGRMSSPAYYLAFLIPAFAVACIVTALTSKKTWMVGILTGALPLAGFALLLLQFGARLPNHMTYGSFLTLAAGVSIIVTSITKD